MRYVGMLPDLVYSYNHSVHRSIKTKTVDVTVENEHGRTGRKKLGGRKEICPTFSDCARVVKKNFPEKLSKIVVHLFL